MRREFLLRYFGRFYLLVPLSFLVPMAVGMLYGDFDVRPFLIPAALQALIGLGLTIWSKNLTRHRKKEKGIRRREGFVVVSGSWISIILWGAIPFLFSDQIPDISSAIFESASGFTTTGATVVKNIEGLSHSLLFWRSFSHWLGGMGIIVLSVAILPELAVGGMQLFSAESSGLGVDRLAPRIATTAKRLWVVYVALTAVEVLLLLPAMSVFDAINHAFATTATGGFSTKNGSVGQFGSLYVDTIITIFMFLAGVNFALQYRFFSGDWRKPFASSEMRLYLGLFVGVTALLTWNLIDAGIYNSIGEALRYTSFQVSAIITTTGFGTADFERWPTFSKCLLVVLMAIGGCAGSTAGGLKVIRLVVVLKHAVRECQRLIHPKLVKPVLIDRKAIDEDTLFSILGFFLLYVVVFVVSMVLLSALPHEQPMSVTTASTAALSALNSIGPGLEGVGPVENFSWIHPFGKLTLSFCMLLGRLEIYTLLILFMPRFWTQR